MPLEVADPRGNDDGSEKAGNSAHLCTYRSPPKSCRWCGIASQLVLPQKPIRGGKRLKGQGCRSRHAA